MHGTFHLERVLHIVSPSGKETNKIPIFGFPCQSFMSDLRSCTTFCPTSQQELFSMAWSSVVSGAQALTSQHISGAQALTSQHISGAQALTSQHISGAQALTPPTHLRSSGSHLTTHLRSSGSHLTNTSQKLWLSAQQHVACGLWVQSFFC